MRNEFLCLSHNQRGGVLIAFAVALVTLIVALGVSIEMGRAFLLRTKAFQALDAATLAASSIARPGVTQQQLLARAQPFFEANFPRGYMGVRGTPPLTIRYDQATSKVTGSVRPDMPLFFAGFLPFKTMGVPVSTEVTRKAQNVEIALALDHTSSMCDPDPNCGSNSLWKGLKDSVDLLFNIASPNNNANRNVYYSYIPFRYTVKVNGTAEYEPTAKGAFTVNSLPSLMGLTTNVQAIRNAMSRFTMKKDDSGGTDSSVGFWWAWSSLRPYRQDINKFRGISAPENPSAHPAPFPFDPSFNRNQPPTYKYLLLLTDGINEYDVKDRSEDYQDVIADNFLRNFCVGAKTQGIVVFTVGYGPQVVSDANIRSILQNCANPGNYYLANDQAALRKAFEDIAYEISASVITQ